MAVNHLGIGDSDGTIAFQEGKPGALFDDGSESTVTRPAAAGQAAVTDNEATITLGVTNMTVGWGFSNENALTTLIGDVSNLMTLVTAIRNALVPTTGLNIMKGAA